jgi:hypothetical protein
MLRLRVNMINLLEKQYFEHTRGCPAFKRALANNVAYCDGRR